MLAFFPYRVMWRGKVSVSKSAYRDGEKVVMRAGVIPERRSTRRAEMETGAVGAVADMLIDFMFAADRHRLRRKPSLRRKSRAAAFLAIIAMAHRDADGFTSAGDGKLAAAAGGCAGHFDAPFSARFASIA